VEKDVPAISLKGWVLQYTTGDKSLIKALGGEEEAGVPFLAYIYHLMELGDEGAGHTDWRSNFATCALPQIKDSGRALGRELRKRVGHRCGLRPTPPVGLAIRLAAFQSLAKRPCRRSAAEKRDEFDWPGRGLSDNEIARALISMMVGSLK
jgi:hypothetical protein